MKISILALAIVSALALSACSEKTPEQKQSQMQASEQANTPELGSFGIDLSSRDLSVKPGDDFFKYASGTWYENYEMPADKTSYGAFAALAERSEDRVKVIVEDLVNKTDKNLEESLIANYFKAYMDISSINEKGIAPIQAMLDEIAAIKSVDDLTRVFGNAWLLNTGSPITVGMGANRLNPNSYQVSVSVSGLGLPDRAYYLEDNERFKEIKAEYEKTIASMLGFANIENAAAKAKGIVALETKMAEAMWPREMRRDRDKTLNQIERANLSEQYQDFNWDLFFAQHGFAAKDLNMTQPEPINDMIDIINETPLEQWKDYLAYHLISGNSSLLSEDIDNANFAFYGTILNGQQEQRPRWKRAVNEMSGTQALGFAIGKVYVDRHFPESSKEQMVELVENLRKALGERITDLDWMGEETKANAKAKLMAFVPKIGYPDKWESFEGLQLSDNDLVGNVQTLRRYFQDKKLADELKPTDRDAWFMAPHRVNAYYNSTFNEIVFPAAILQAPFFDPNADAAVNYGAIGAVIGHEMGHGFDDQGSKSDAKGIQQNWWTDADRSAFDAKTKMLIEQYAQYEALPGQFVNGANSVGENIGDVGGLSMAYHAYKLSLNGDEAPIIDGLTGDQRFFLAWAQVWRIKRTQESMLSRLRGGTHAPGKFRTLAPRNHDAWYEAFDVKPGDALYLAPQDRVRIW